MNERVSIIVVNYNTFDLTCQCLRSIVATTMGVPYEIILVDNGSTERDPREFLQEFPSVKLLALKANVGFAKGNNEGTAVSTGHYVLFLNSDTILRDDSVTALYLAMKKYDDVAVATGKLLFSDGRLQGVCQRFPSLLLFLFEISRLQKLYPRRTTGMILFGSFFKYDEEAFPDWVWGTFMMIRKDVIHKLPQGKLNDDYFMYCEDIQWCMDFRNAGYRTMFTPTAQVVHLMGGSSANKTGLIRTNFEKFLDKNYNVVHAWILKQVYRYYYR